MLFSIRAMDMLVRCTRSWGYHWKYTRGSFNSVLNILLNSQSLIFKRTSIKSFAFFTFIYMWIISKNWTNNIAHTIYTGFPLFRTDKIPWYFHDFSRFLVNFQVFFSLFLRYDFQVVMNINMQTFWGSFEQKINYFNYNPN